MADYNLNEQGKILAQQMVQTMNQELEQEKIAHEQLMKQISDLVLVRQQEEKDRVLLQQINIISNKRKKENLKNELTSAINEHKYSVLRTRLNSPETNLLAYEEKIALFNYAVQQYSQKGMLILLEFFGQDFSIEIKREFFAKVVLCKIPHPDQSVNKTLLYSGNFLNDFLQKADIPKESLKEYMPSSIAENAENRINNRNKELKVKVSTSRVQSS